jgi:hypothetical protein
MNAKKKQECIRSILTDRTEKYPFKFKTNFCHLTLRLSSDTKNRYHIFTGAHTHDRLTFNRVRLAELL